MLVHLKTKSQHSSCTIIRTRHWNSKQKPSSTELHIRLDVHYKDYPQNEAGRERDDSGSSLQLGAFQAEHRQCDRLSLIRWYWMQSVFQNAPKAAKIEMREKAPTHPPPLQNIKACS